MWEVELFSCLSELSSFSSVVGCEAGPRCETANPTATRKRAGKIGSPSLSSCSPESFALQWSRYGARVMWEEIIGIRSGYSGI